MSNKNTFYKLKPVYHPRVATAAAVSLEDDDDDDDDASFFQAIASCVAYRFCRAGSGVVF